MIETLIRVHDLTRASAELLVRSILIMMWDFKMVIYLIRELGQEHRAHILKELYWSANHIGDWLLWADKLLLRACRLLLSDV